MDEQFPGKLSRRNVLRIMAASLSAAAAGVPLQAKPSGQSELSAQAETPIPYQPKFFTQEQMHTLDVLSEAIIPADEHSPGASAAKVSQYMDIIVSSGSSKEKALWQDGIASLDRMAKRAGYEGFRHCSAPQRDLLLEQLSEQEEHPETTQARFFVAAKEATIDGYYTSAIGIHEDLQYQGNSYLLDFDGCNHDEHKS